MRVYVFLDQIGPGTRRNKCEVGGPGLTSDEKNPIIMYEKRTEGNISYPYQVDVEVLEQIRVQNIYDFHDCGTV